MAVAAFNSSSSRRPTAATSSSSATRSSTTAAANDNSNSNRAPIRRSRSVSAFSRTRTSSDGVSTEFLNKRDNPLFDETAQSNETAPEASTPAVSRGRPSARTSEPVRARSISRVDTGRRTRSASQCPVSRRNLNYSTSESEAECRGGSGVKFGGSSSNRRTGLTGRIDNGVRDSVKDLHTWTSQHSSPELSDSFAATLSGLQNPNCDDVVSTASSGFGSDEKTIKAVYEQMKSVQTDQPEAGDIYETVRTEVRRAVSEIRIDLESAIRRSNATAIAVTNVANIPPDLVEPGTVELILETRRDYAKKLEESRERARNLRADLAVEEHRGQELDRILKEVLLCPMTPNVQKPRPARKSSIERRRMSKRLEEDAKAYFDECVSLSTFDSSDFSSQEDPPLNLVGSPAPSGSHAYLAQESGTRQQSLNLHYEISQPPASINTVEAIPQVSSITGSTDTGCKPCFSFAQKASETSILQQDIQQYIKKFEKNVLKLPTMKSNCCDLSEYSLQSSAESLLIDRVQLKNRIESGSLLVCSGGNILSSKSFGIGI